MDTEPKPITVYYDGTCGLCHGAVQFLLRRDREGTRFRYAPLQGETALSVLGDVADLPDSIAVHARDGAILIEGAAALAIGTALGGLWAAAAWLGRLFPRILLDTLYRMVARRRYRWFGRKEDLCPLLSPEQRKLFLP